MAFRDDVAFRFGDVLSEQPMVLGFLAEQRQRSAVARTPGRRSPKAALDAVDWRRFFEALKPFL